MEIKVIEKIKDTVATGKRVALVTLISLKGSLPGKPGLIMAVTETGDLVGTIGGGNIEKIAINNAKELMKKGISKEVDIKTGTSENPEDLLVSNVKVFIRCFFPKEKMIIIGAGHVAYEIYKIASDGLFETHIVDNRESLFRNGKFSKAKEIITKDTLKYIENIQIDNNMYFILAGPNHRQDESFLKRISNRGAKYIGMLGSKNKLREIEENLKKEGIGKIENLYCPVGIKLGSNEPSEIAIGIIAEVLMVKNAKIQ